MTRLSSPRTPATTPAPTIQARHHKSKRNSIAGNPSFYPDGRLIPSTDLVDVVCGISGNKMLLGISGKDSLAMWLYLRERKVEIIPYFLYTVPHMSFDDEMLFYYEKFFKTKIYRLPHPFFYQMLINGEYMAPDAAVRVGAMDLWHFDWNDVENILAEDNHLPANYFSAIGYRAADSLGRRSFIELKGTLGLKKRHYYFAIWDWNLAQTLGIIERYNCKLSRSYQIYGSTGDGFFYSDIILLRDKSPQDYKKVLEWFPLLEAELFRYEQVK
jgi:hypothetical protein